MLCCVEEGRGEEGRERKEGGRKKEWREGDEEGRRDRKWGGKLFEKAVTTGICGPCSVGQAGRAARSPSPSCVHLPPTKTMRNRGGSFLRRVLQTQSSQNTKAFAAVFSGSPRGRPSPPPPLPDPRSPCRRRRRGALRQTPGWANTWRPRGPEEGADLRTAFPCLRCWPHETL